MRRGRNAERTAAERKVRVARAGTAMLGLIVALAWTIGVQIPIHWVLDRDGTGMIETCS